jgi:hypothetical protein
VTSPRLWRKIFKAALRLSILAVVLLAVNLGVGALIKQLENPLAASGFMLNLTLGLIWLAYVLLLAVPFVPSMEIGVSLLISHGAVAAPFVYAGTLSGLMLAYFVGVLLSGPLSCKFLMFFGLKRVCAFVEEIKRLNHQQRLARMQRALPDWAGRWVLGHRSLLLVALLNLPGNSVIGGGGGIALLSGLSRTFTTLQFTLTIALATAPVPLLVWFFGTGVLT